MLKYLVDLNEKRDIVVIFSNKYAEEIVYKDVLDEAAKVLHIKTIYTLTDVEKIPQDWTGERGRISAEIINRDIPDWKERYFYLSGPHPMVAGFEKTLDDMGAPSSQIKKDFFPGFA
jgi:ferredoxin-NADP reductase